MLELIQPSHVTTADTISSCAMHCIQNPDSRLTTKNGSQQMMKTPITMPSVLAAFFSLANLANFRDNEKFLPMWRWRADDIPFVCISADSGSSSGSSGVDVAVADGLSCISCWSCSWCSGGGCCWRWMRRWWLGPSRVVPPRWMRSVSWSSPLAIITCLVPILSDRVWMTAAL